MLDPAKKPAPIDRRSFIQQSSAAALMPLLGSPAGKPEGLGEEYLIKGLTGLARTCDKGGWFQAHWGAAVLASYYLCQENDLDERIKSAVKIQTDAMIRKYGFYFSPLKKEEPDPALIGKVARALEQPISGLRASGHAVTFAALGLRALKDVPRIATPTLIEGLCKISGRIGKKRPLADHAYNRKNPLPPYSGEESIAEAVFDCILRYEGVRFPPANTGGLRRPNFTHQLTYSDALVQLHRMGYTDLAKRGHAPHQVYVNTAPPDTAKRNRKLHSSARLEVVLSPGFWEEEANARNWKNDFDVKSNRMGDWIVGHLFKILYSYTRLRKLVKDPEKIRRVDRIVLERYVDPTTAGG